jgi:hypothetical protein
MLFPQCVQSICLIEIPRPYSHLHMFKSGITKGLSITFYIAFHCIRYIASNDRMITNDDLEETLKETKVI